MFLNPTEHIQQQLFWYGYYEKEVGDLLKKIAKPDDVFIDIGANIGYFSLLIATNVESVKVISFEPVKDLFQKMNDNVSLNGIKNITTVNAAAGDINEEKDLFVSAADNSGMSSFQQPENYSGHKEKVKVVAIDDWVISAGLSKIDLIKLDIEGSELAALKGMKRVLQQQKPMVITEINPGTLAMFNLKPSDVCDYLTQFGFEPFLISENTSLRQMDTWQIDKTINVLFAHHEKIESLSPFIAR